MKIRTHRLAWAVFFLFAGAFLLLNNLKVFREFGDGIWGGLFAVVASLPDLVPHRPAAHLAAIAGFPLLTIGALLLLDWRGIDLGVWQAALVLFGVALGFWTVLLFGDDTWWALIPAGVLTLMGVLIGFQARCERGGVAGPLLPRIGCRVRTALSLAPGAARYGVGRRFRPQHSC